jgi:pre-mRNA-splicing helicase BRR2
VERFSSSLTAKSKLKGLLHTMCAASEFEHLPVRHKEPDALERLAKHLPLQIEDPGHYNEPHVKANVLLQAHFSRVPLIAAVAADQARVLPDAIRLLQVRTHAQRSPGCQPVTRATPRPCDRPWWT